MRLRRQLVDIEQRQRAAGDLLGTAERIAVERLEQRRRVERGRGTDRERNRAGARHQIGEQIVRQRQALAPGERLHRAARQHLRRRLDVQRIGALEREVAGTGDLSLRCRPRPRPKLDTGTVMLVRCLAPAAASVPAGRRD